MFRSYDQIAHYLTNALGELNDDAPRPLSPEEERLYVAVKGDEECVYAVETVHGERGVLFNLEFSHTDSQDEHERGAAIEAGFPDEEGAWRSARAVAEFLRNRGCRHVFLGRRVGLFDRHEVGLFVPFNEIQIEDAQRWAELWNQAVLAMNVSP